MADVSEESPAQRQARLRREKRNAKITAQGGDRLAKITGLSGRPPPVPEKDSTPAAQPSTASSAADPDEVDISEHHWDPNADRIPSNITQKPLPRTPLNDAAADPMMQMMQQMMSSMPGATGSGPSPLSPGSPGEAGQQPELPPFLQAMLAGQQKTTQQAEQQPPPSDSAYLWRVLHAVFALSMAAYVVLTTPFTGTKLARFEGAGGVEGDDGQSTGLRLFYIFATVETVLQSSRYFLEKGRLGGTGWLATIANSGVVPEPFNGYIRVVGRYATIWNTVVADAMTVVFVLGAVAWWRGAVGA